MITLLLLHPLKRNPVQSWSFENESVIRIGRSTDNNVILYSAVVSRHHVELRHLDSRWEIVNLGTNGTYLDGKRITKVPVVDGAIIRLARSGPNIQIRLGTEALKDLPEHLASDVLAGQRIDHHPTITDITDSNHQMKNGFQEANALHQEDGEPPTGTIPVPPHLRISGEQVLTNESVDKKGSSSSLLTSKLRSSLPLSVKIDDERLRPPSLPSKRVLKTVQEYQILQVLGQGPVGITYLAEYEGKACVLKTLNADWLRHPKAVAALEMEAALLGQLQSPHIPQLIDFFVAQNCPYLVMEKIDGYLLSQQLTQNGKFSLSQAIAKMLRICDIVSYLHQFVPPVLHRNIEASNIICHHQTNELVLISFGAIKSLVLERDTSVGSHGCTAPNQLSVNATPQVDLYSLAPMLAYFLTGKNPVAFCKRQGNNQYQFVADAVTGLSDRVITILRRLTHPNKEFHYPSIEAVSDALRSLSAI